MLITYGKLKFSGSQTMGHDPFLGHIQLIGGHNTSFML